VATSADGALQLVATSADGALQLVATSADGALQLVATSADDGALQLVATSADDGALQLVATSADDGALQLVAHGRASHMSALVHTTRTPWFGDWCLTGSRQKCAYVDYLHRCTISIMWQCGGLIALPGRLEGAASLYWPHVSSVLCI
jgi:hypothetical protein